MNMAVDNTLRHAVTGSLAIHLVAFLLLVLGLHHHLSSEPEPQTDRDDEFVLVLTAVPEFEPPPEPEPLTEPEPEPEEPEPEPEPEPEASEPERRFVVADHVQPAAEAPEAARFESDRDTVAGSRTGPDPDGPADMPSLTGDSPFEAFSAVDATFQDGDEPTPPPLPAQPEPAAPPVAVAVPVVEPQPTPEPEPQPEPTSPMEIAAVAEPADLVNDPLAEEELLVAEAEEPTEMVEEPEVELAETEPEESRDALPPEPQDEAPPLELADAGEPAETMMDLPRPDPVMLEPFEPGTPRQPEQRVRDQRGGAEWSEVDSFLAMQTAEGEYKRQLYGVIERRWRRLTNQNLAMKTYSQVKVAVVIERDGSILSARITESAASPAMREAALRAVQEGRLPPVPEEIPAPYYYAMEFLVY